MNLPSTEDRTLFFDRLIEAAMSVLLEGISKKSQDTRCHSELPKAPKLVSGPKVSELKAKVEAEQHALRRLRMCLRDICNRYVNICLMYNFLLYLHINFNYVNLFLSLSMFLSVLQDII